MSSALKRRFLPIFTGFSTPLSISRYSVDDLNLRTSMTSFAVSIGSMFVILKNIDGHTRVKIVKSTAYLFRREIILNQRL